jgi:Flp pilus assembly protein TadD
MTAVLDSSAFSALIERRYSKLYHQPDWKRVHRKRQWSIVAAAREMQRSPCPTTGGGQIELGVFEVIYDSRRKELTLWNFGGMLLLALTVYPFAIKSAKAQAISADAIIDEQRGEEFLASKKFDQAAMEFRKGLQLSPKLPRMHNKLGLALVGEGTLPAALAEFKEALRLDPEFTEARSNLGLTLLKMSQAKAAADELRAVVNTAPSVPESHYRLGLALASAGDAKGATSEFRKAIELRANYPEALNNLGVVLAAQGIMD